LAAIVLIYVNSRRLDVFAASGVEGKKRNAARVMALPGRLDRHICRIGRPGQRLYGKRNVVFAPVQTGHIGALARVFSFRERPFLFIGHNLQRFGLIRGFRVRVRLVSYGVLFIFDGFFVGVVHSALQYEFTL
jgi:hypothetical protein